jgi:carboxyl-terminal processing protease
VPVIGGSLPNRQLSTDNPHLVFLSGGVDEPMSWRNLIYIAIILCLAGLSIYLSGRSPLTILRTDPQSRELSGVVSAYETIRQQADAELSSDQACQGAIEGMVHRLDPYSVYIPPDKAGAFSRRVMAGRLDETGVRLAQQGDKIILSGCLADSPADKAGLAGGMELLSIDGRDADEMTLAQAQAAASGQPDSTVKLVFRQGRQNREVILRAASFALPSVTGLVREGDGWDYNLDDSGGICYLRITEFLEQTAQEFHQAYQRLPHPRALVLDLRDNPGGLKDSAVAVAERFLSQGLIVRTVRRDGHQETCYAHSDGEYPLLPMVVLIDGQTASAAEIVAGALQAHGRAALLGARSFGKWSVQSTISLGPGLGLLYMTTGHYYLDEPPSTGPTASSGAATSAATSPARQRPGLMPDIEVKLSARSAERLAALRLQGELVRANPSTAPSTAAPAALKREILRSDAQLAAAVQFLRQAAPATAPAGGPGDAQEAP